MSSLFSDFFNRQSAQNGPHTQQDKPARVMPISPAQARERLAGENPPVLLDVRSPEEYREGHIPGSRMQPLHELNAKSEGLPQDRSTPLIVYCLSGARSAQAASMLVRMGYREVYNLGGILSWPYAIEPGR